MATVDSAAHATIPGGGDAAPDTVLRAIYARRSVRSYEQQPVSAEMVRALIAAAVRAPTAMGEEPWVFAVVQNTDRLRRLSDLAKPLFADELHRANLDHGGHGLEMFSNPNFNIFYDAGSLIVICCRPSGTFATADCWLAAENLMLAACALGLGTCVIGSAVPFLNSPDGRAQLGIPPDLEVIAPIIVGVPSGETPAVPRKPAEIAVWK